MMKQPSLPGLTSGRQTSEPLSRRRFLKQFIVLSAAVSCAAGSAIAVPRRQKKLPKPQHSGIEHVVVVMMENRSFDHFLGWLPDANGRQAGLNYADSSGAAHPTFPLAPDYQGCSHPDPDHSYPGARVEFKGGACDGWLRAGQNDLYAIGYYTQADLPFLGHAAPAWTACDNYFSAFLGPTYPNRIYQHAAQTDRLADTLLPISTLPTIWDRLADQGVTGKYYFSDLPILAFWGAKYVPISRPISDFFADAAAGNLPQVSFVDPRMIGEGVGISGDDHPHGDIREGEDFMNRVYEAVTASPNWPETVLVINFDEWGGFFEHVPPPLAPLPLSDAGLGSDGRRGFRVPALVISPWSPRGTVAHGLYDHTSVLKMIEWRWSLPPLTVRDASANNLAEILDFHHPDLDAPGFAVPAGPFGVPCSTDTSEIQAAQALLAYLRSVGFPVP
jgi:phospholipase C